MNTIAKEEIDKIKNEDYLTILKYAKRLEKLGLNAGKENKVKIAVLGSHSIQHFTMVLRLYLFKLGIECEIYQGEYNGIEMDVLNENSELYYFQPQIVILMTYNTDIKEFPDLLADEAVVTNQAMQKVSYYMNMWKKLSVIHNIHILQTNFVVPPITELNNLEANYLFSKSNFYRILNLEMIKCKPMNVNLVDLDTLASNLGKWKWFDYSAYFLNKAGFKLDYIGYVAELFAKQINTLCANIKKCLVLDLDNTLWGGVVGDDGCYGIQLDPNHAIGEAFRFFQKYILELKKRGVILAVCSKNDEDIAKEPFLKNEHMVLHLEDISCFVANWDDKATNIKKIAFELNIGLDSLVFFDDNPAEREIVKYCLPQVQIIDVPEDPADYALALNNAAPFEWLQITKEDLMRSATYYSNQERAVMERNFVNYDEYLQALHMHGKIGIVNEKHIERYTQLINKSNQFNLRTRRYTDSEILKLINMQDYKLIYIKLQDKFSDYGIISCIILKKINDVCFIDTWLMSCRVLKRGVENYAFHAIKNYAKQMGCKKIIGEYIPTKKNKMVENFYDKLNFTKLINTDLTDLYNLKAAGTFYIYENLDLLEHACYIMDNSK